jgi:CubicO group peptidase (beta-lactamase class C family)
MILADRSVNGRQLVSPDLVRQMLTDHLTDAQRHSAQLFLEGQGWGFGGSVDVAPNHPWNVPGRYGWVGGTGTSAHLIPSDDTVTILLTQVGVTAPVPTALQLDLWRGAARPHFDGRSEQPLSASLPA